MRCKLHDLACPPDGLCVVCRRTAARSVRPAARSLRPAAPPKPKAPIGVGLAVLLASMIGAGAYRVHSLHASQSAAPIAGPDNAPSARLDDSEGARSPDAHERSGTFGARRAALESQPSPMPTVTVAASAAPSASAIPAADSPAPAPEPPQEVSLSDVNVVVYTATWCSVCKRAKAWMNQQGIAYEDRDVDSSPENARAMRSLNPRGSIPTFDVDGEVMVGFSDQGLLATMHRAARKDAARRRW